MTAVDGAMISQLRQITPRIFDHFRLTVEERTACWQDAQKSPYHALNAYRAIAATLPLSFTAEDWKRHQEFWEKLKEERLCSTLNRPITTPRSR